MKIERTNRLLTFSITVVILLTSLSGFFFLYRTAINEEQERLEEMAASEAAFVNAVAEFDKQYSDDYPGGSREATISQIVDAFMQSNFTSPDVAVSVGYLAGDKIKFVVHNNEADKEETTELLSVPIDSPLAEPMRRALMTQNSGTMTGLNFRGRRVVAAYEAIPSLEMGIVTQIDLDTLRRPFVQTGIVIVIITLVLLTVASGLLHRLITPLITRIRTSEERLQHAIAGSSEGIWDWPDTSRDEYWSSPQCWTLLGYRENEIPATFSQFMTLLHPDDQESVQTAVQRHLRQGDLYHVEVRMLKKSGDYSWFSLRGASFSDPETGKTRMTGSIRNIDKLKQVQQKLENLIQSVPGIVFECIIQPEYSLVYISEAVANITGYKPDDFLQGRISWPDNVIHPEDRNTAFGTVRNSIDTGELFQLEYRIQTAAGDIRWVWEQARAYTGPARGEIIMQGIIADITALKQAEFELEQKNRTLQTLSECNRSLISAQDEQSLFDAFCRNIVQDSGCSGAWAGLLTGNDIRVMAAAGTAKRWEAVTSLADTDPVTAIIARVAQSGKREIVTTERDNGEQDVPAAAQDHTLMAFPLLMDNDVGGVLLAEKFGPAASYSSDIPIPEELASDLAFGVLTLRNRERQHQIELQREIILNHLVEAVLVIDAEGVIQFANPAAEAMLKHEGSTLIGSIFGSLVSDDSYAELRIITRTGEVGTAHLRSTEINWNGLDATLISLHDMTDFVKLQEKLKHEATHDALTGLPNRILLLDRLDIVRKQSQRRPQKLESAVVFIDLDDFKLINDSLGHETGDAVLIQVAKKLQESLRAGDTVARFGGDEFVLLLEELNDVNETLHIVRRILDSLKDPVHIGSRVIHTNASAGISFLRENIDSRDLLRDADIALYRSKQQGRGQLIIFDEKMHKDAIARLNFESKLSDAVEKSQFLLYLQPIVFLDSGRTIGCEALVRWEQDGEIIPPGKFIPLAEETNLIIPIGQWVLGNSCATLHQWYTTTGDPQVEYISVNLSARQLARQDQAAILESIIQSYDLTPEYIRLEVTESMMMELHGKVIPILERFKNLGIKICLDDFGTGYSSLSYLRDLPIDVLKIDRSFITGIDKDKQRQSMMTAIVSLADNLGLETVGEGIETPQERQTLLDIGVQFGQGYLFSKPIPSGDIAEYLKRETLL